MAGRSRKIIDISTGNMRNSEKISRKIQEENLKLDRDGLENMAPSWLRPAAVEEFNRVVEETKKIGLLDNLDVAVLALYADNYVRYIEVARLVNEEGVEDAHLLTVLYKTADIIFKCSAKLGLSATDRLKLVVPVKEERSVNKFLRYLK